MMVNPFRYSKKKHVRRRTPPAYQRYQQFKNDLREEFFAQCVYCRALDRVTGVDNFGVDHYRPKSNALFAHLQTEYMNLYYCCNRCNRLKREYWPPTPEDARERYIPNPCDHVMFEHLRYLRGEVVPASSPGRFTTERLDLNDPDAVAFRNAFIAMLARLNSAMEETNALLSEATARKNVASTAEEHNAAVEAIVLAHKARALQQEELENAIGLLTLAGQSVD